MVQCTIFTHEGTCVSLFEIYWRALRYLAADKAAGRR